MTYDRRKSAVELGFSPDCIETWRNFDLNEETQVTSRVDATSPAEGPTDWLRRFENARDQV